MVASPIVKNVLIKVSGEMLAGSNGTGIDLDTLNRFALEIHNIRKMSVNVAIVLGGGNIFRGVAGAAVGMDRSSADSMGMLATVINALALQDALERRGCYTRVMSAINMQAVCEPYIRRRAIRHMEKGRVIILAAGTGNPYFTTDTAAALRAAEIGSELIMKATKVDGVYDKDPVVHSDAVKYDQISYLEVLSKELRVMDAAAISLCMDNSIPIVVFDLNVEGNMERVVCGDAIGTHVGHPPK